MTSLGKFIAAIIMVLCYGIIAVPTGIVSYEKVRAQTTPENAPVTASAIMIRMQVSAKNVGKL